MEFCSAEDIAQRYPHGVRELADGGTHNIAAGQPTDDSEMALALARSLVRCEGYDVADVGESYVRWANSDAFDIGEATTAALLRRAPNPNSQANGALMRISPLAVAYWRNLARAGELACKDAAITRPHPVCIDANSRYASALADIISGGLHQPRRGIGVSALMEWLASQSAQWEAEWQAIGAMVDSGEPDFSVHQGWLSFALWALHEELRRVEDKTTTFEDSLVRVIGRGGDTDTNVTIVGAFLGGVFGASAIAHVLLPISWTEKSVID